MNYYNIRVYNSQYVIDIMYMYFDHYTLKIELQVNAIFQTIKLKK